MKPLSVEVVINTVRWVAYGHAPFLVRQVSPTHWMVADRGGSNCVAHPQDGVRAIFPSESLAILLCQQLNDTVVP